MAEKKLSTEEILALARQQDSQGGGSAGAESEPSEDSPGEVPQESAAAQEPPAKAEETAEQPSSASGPAGSTPKSTADILAAARSEAAGGQQAHPSEQQAAEEKPKASESASKPSQPAPGAKSRPTSTKDILAAARAEAAGSGGEAAEQKPPAKSGKAGKPATQSPVGTKTKAKPVATGKDGPRPSVQEMLKAVREGKPRGEEQPAKKPVFPQKPAPPKAKPVQKESRRSFLVRMVATPFAAGWTLFTAASVAAGLAMARFMMPNAIVEPPSKFKVGTPEDYPLGTVSTKWKSEFGIWITHQVYNGQPQLYALASICTHLGCTPNWLEAEQKFKCPCHGSGFYPDGINFEGPAPRPLERYGIRVAPDGLLEVDKSATFQEEMGQWTDPASFVATTA